MNSHTSKWNRINGFNCRGEIPWIRQHESWNRLLFFCWKRLGKRFPLIVQPYWTKLHCTEIDFLFCFVFTVTSTSTSERPWDVLSDQWHGTLQSGEGKHLHSFQLYRRSVRSAQWGKICDQLRSLCVRFREQGPKVQANKQPAGHDWLLITINIHEERHGLSLTREAVKLFYELRKHSSAECLL